MKTQKAYVKNFCPMATMIDDTIGFNIALNRLE